MANELRDFIVHLRLHYQIFILSGAYLLGGLFATVMDPVAFGLQFLNVHVLLFGGATAYNSYWDKDEGPIGGLKHPPRMTPWMHPVSLTLQVVGLAWAGLAAGPLFALVYGVSILYFWLYSTPHARWKGRPLLSLVAIGISTGTNGFLLGYLACGPRSLPGHVLLGAVGVASILLSMYPVSQIFQIDEDGRQGVRTFTIAYGLGGVRRFFVGAYLVGLVLIAVALSVPRPRIGPLFAAVGLISFFVVFARLRSLKGEESEYDPVMRLKYVTSLLFAGFICACLAYVHLA